MQCHWRGRLFHISVLRNCTLNLCCEGIPITITVHIRVSAFGITRKITIFFSMQISQHSMLQAVPSPSPSASPRTESPLLASPRTASPGRSPISSPSLMRSFSGPDAFPPHLERRIILKRSQNNLGRICLFSNKKWASSWDYATYHIGEQRRLRRACASVQSPWSLRCLHIWSMEVDKGSNQKSDI